MKTYRFVVFLISAALTLGSRPGLAADEQEQKDAAPVLSKAAGLVDLQASGGAPFLLLANVALHEGSKSTNGVFAMAWAGPGQYRRVFRFPGFTTTEVVTDGAIYRQRTTEVLPLMIWELDGLLSVASAYRLTPRSKVSRVQTERTGATELTCVLTRTDLTDSRICVNAVTGEPFSVARGVDAYHLESLRERYEFGDYRPFEGHSFPHKLTFRGWNSHVVEVQVQKLIRVETFAADEFRPPSGSSRMHFCDSPETKGEVKPSTGNAIPIGFSDVEVDMYFQVGPSGGVRSAQVVYSSDPLKNKEILNWFTGTHFPIKTCSGTPIAYETLIRFKTGH
jgi:hypothetical protein